jgi:MFS family permease
MNSPLQYAPGHLALWLVLLAATGSYALTAGVRQSMGLFVSPLHTATGLGIGSISLAFAFGQLWWSLTQPVAGAIADKVGAGRVLFVGVLLVALGTFITPYMTSTLGLIFAVGVLAAGGAGMAGPAVLMPATTRLIDPARRGIAFGVVNSGASFGQFLIAPIVGVLMLSFGWASAMQVLALVVLLSLPAAFVLRGAPQPQSTTATHKLSAREAARVALRTPSYLLLAGGFFVCGFHVAFLATHLPGVIAACGLPLQFGAWALALLGLFNMAGSLAIGWAMARWRSRSLLALLYAVRALAVLLFLLAPKTGPAVLVFAAVMGLTFLSTVPPTAGLVAKFFGPANMGTQFGIIMLVHQVGAFFGVWLGGKAFEITGSYDGYWYVDILLAVGAALIHLPIREARVQRAAA